MGYVEGQDAPRLADEAAIAAGVAQAAAAVKISQAEAATFFQSYGDAVVAGHVDVGAPGRQGDPDLAAPDAADSRG